MKANHLKVLWLVCRWVIDWLRIEKTKNWWNEIIVALRSRRIGWESTKQGSHRSWANQSINLSSVHSFKFHLSTKPNHVQYYYAVFGSDIYIFLIYNLFNTQKATVQSKFYMLFLTSFFHGFYPKKKKKNKTNHTSIHICVDYLLLLVIE
jgi:hypothetical protein